jgi:hypothetical protein
MPLLWERMMSLACLATMMCIAVLCGCASTSPIKPAVIEIDSQYGFIHKDDDVVIVKSMPGDTLDALAAKYLNDPSKAWAIAQFNGIQTLLPGEEIVIPLKPVHLGGFYADGIQKVPILLYHDFSTTRSSKMKVLASSFEAQMKYLKDNDYRVISLDRFLNFIEFKDQIRCIPSPIPF